MHSIEMTTLNIFQWVGSIDLSPNEEAHANILVELSESWTAQEQQVSQKVEEALGGEKVDAVLCVAGGWAGGNAASKGTQRCAMSHAKVLSHCHSKR